MIFIFLIPLIIILLLLFCIFPGFKRNRKIKGTEFYREYAHRGLWSENSPEGIPENSLAAFKNAAEKGYAIELDIQLSMDGEVMVFHDDSLKRMTGVDKKLSECTSHELSHVSLCRTKEHIPTLKEVLSAVDGRVPLLIELKGESSSSALCPKADEILKNYKGSYCVESFNPILISWYRKNRPHILRGQLVTDSHKTRKGFLYFLLDNLLLNFLSRPDFIAFDMKIADKIPVKLATEFFKAERFTWTAKTHDEREWAKSAGACAIFEEKI